MNHDLMWFYRKYYNKSQKKLQPLPSNMFLKAIRASSQDQYGFLYPEHSLQLLKLLP